MTISQKIAMTIDREADHPSVRPFFVNHEGKKTLTVRVGPSIYGVDYPLFFKQMSGQIKANINKPEYTDAMESGFTSSTPVHKIVNHIMLMYSFQKYFEYRMMTLCGIPGVIMMGAEEDWRNMIDKLQTVENVLKPIEEQLKLADWFKSCKTVLLNLLETFRGNPDKDWWSRIMTIDRQFGSGGGTYINGWYVRDFLGKTGSVDFHALKSGVNAVPLTITDGCREEEAALVAGVTGYKVEEKVTDPETNTSFPSVRAVQGWGLLMRPEAAFR